MGEPTLIEFDNARRFYPSRIDRCPQCGGEALVDDWPPNYAGGSLNNDGTSESGGDIKHVCLACRISFVITWYEKVSRGVTDASRRAVDIKPLVERDGKLLTPHDVRQQEYYDEHGEWPQESYG